MGLTGWDDTSLSIDRIDTNGNYEPNNIRFTNAHVQAANRNPRLSRSGYAGVFQEKDGFYGSSIKINGNAVYLGRFTLKEDAINARNNYILENNLTEYPVQLFY